ncbi:MAG: hypothetical protein ACRCSQ_01280 [Bacteroidales bacterium]
MKQKSVFTKIHNLLSLFKGKDKKICNEVANRPVFLFPSASFPFSTGFGIRLSPVSGLSLNERRPVSP